MKKICIFILIIFAICVPVNALEFATSDDPVSVCGYNTNELLYVNSTSIIMCDNTGAYESVFVYGFTSPLEDIYYDKEYIYTVCFDGSVYRIDYSEMDSISNYTSNGGALYLGDVGSGHTYFPHRLYVDSEGNVFVTDPVTSNNAIYVFISNMNYAKFQYYTEASTGLSVGWMGIYGGSDGLYLLDMYHGIYLLEADLTYTQVLNIGNSMTKSLQVIDNDNLVYGYYSGGASDSVGTLSLYEANSSDSYSIDLLGTATSTYLKGDIYVDQNGVVYVADGYNNKIKTFATVSGLGGYEFLSSSLSNSSPSNQNASISWEYDEYSTGETATILFNVDSPDHNAYDYKVEVHDTTSLKQTSTIEDVENNSITYTFPATATSSTYLAQLIAIDRSTGVKDVLAMKTTSFDNEGAYSIDFDSGTYHIGDTMSIYYSVPANSSIYLRGTDSSSKVVYSNTWSVSGSSHLSLTVPENTVESYTAYAFYNGYTLDYDVAEIIQAENQVSVYGVVYDAQTGATIENAHILIDGSGPYSNEIGRYSYIIDAGTYTLACSKTGYQTQYYSSVSFMTDTNRPFYMVPTSSSPVGTTASLYGAVRDYETGNALEGVMLTVANSTGFTKTTFTSSTGFYQVSELLNNSSYSVYSSLDGYDNYYNSSITVTGMTWLEFSLVDEDYSLGTGTDGSTTTTTDRPGRAGAEQTLADLEEIVPSLVTIIVFVVFMAVMKKA